MVGLFFKVVAALSGWFFRTVTGLTEALLSRRGLALFFLTVAAALAVASCLRPPLSQDILSVRIPLGVWKGGSPAPEDLLNGSSKIPYDSAGVLLLAVIAAGMVVVFLAPQRFGLVAGLLFSVAIAVGAAAALNHPALIELMDHEYEQRAQIASVLPKLSAAQTLPSYENGRVDASLAPREEEQRADLVRGWVYWQYWTWFLVWILLGVVLGCAGGLWQRLRTTLAWGLLGVVLACGVCFQRLYAERAWSQAKRLEGEGNYAGSRRALERAVARFPEFERLERTWLLRGKLDWREGRSTPQERFFRIYQLARDKAQPRAYVTREDLPWLINIAADERQGLGSPDTGSELIGNTPKPPTAVGAREDRRGHLTPPSPIAKNYPHARELEQRQAGIHAEELLAAEGANRPAVRFQTARIWTDIGLTFFTKEKVWTDPGREYALRHRELTTAHDAWRKAAEMMPGKRDCSFYMALVQAVTDRDHPRAARDRLAAMLSRLADRPLHAYILSLLGDAYSEAGELTGGRKFYAESYDVFCLPKRINNHAQKALGGI
jgi:hypothetical protein